MQSLLQLAEMLTKHVMNLFMISGYYYTVDLQYHCNIGYHTGVFPTIVEGNVPFGSSIVVLEPKP